MRQHIALALVLFVTSLTWSQGSDSKTQPKEDVRLSRNTPEGTLRLFALGVMLGDEKLVRSTMLPVKAEEWALLVKMPDGSTTKNAEIFRKQCAELKVKSLKAGDKFKLPGGKEIVVTDKEVTEKAMVMVLGDAAIPTRIYKSERGFWWVDGRPTIAARKAAAEMKKRREAAKAKDSTKAEK